jgi:hypothetical protein
MQEENYDYHPKDNPGYRFHYLMKKYQTSASTTTTIMIVVVFIYSSSCLLRVDGGGSRTSSTIRSRGRYLSSKEETDNGNYRARNIGRNRLA